MLKINANDFIGREYQTNYSGKCFVVDVKSSYDMTVMFYDGYCAKVYKGNLDKGKVYNPYYKGNLMYGVGVFDRPKIVDRVSCTKIRTMWYNMLERCYCEKFHKKQPTYAGMTVSEDWKMFSKFERDVKEMVNFEKCLTENWALDKDSIVVGNKVYSKDTCCFIPQSLNSKLSTLTNLETYGSGCSMLPYGSYRVLVGGHGKRGHVGCYKTLDEAFSVYKSIKGKMLLKEIQEYAGSIDSRAVDSVRSYILRCVPELIRDDKLVGVI